MSEQSQPEFLVPPVRVDGPVILEEPDAAWAAQYAHEEDRIRTALSDRAVQVEHVGSTAVPELPAKPVIDIVLTVSDSADEATYLPDLEAVGYVLCFREPEWHEHRFLRRHANVQVHVFTVGSTEVERMILFRDRLRSQPEERDLYERTKRELAAQRWDYVQDYADAKSAVVETIISRARTASGMPVAEVLAILDVLQRNGCRVWVAGGWGVDALVGRLTRPHRDLDLALAAEDADLALSLLDRRGYRIETDWRPIRVELISPGRGWVDLHPVVFDSDGFGRQADVGGRHFDYPPAAFGTGLLAGQRVPCLSRDQQIRFHSGYPARLVDAHDLALLHGNNSHGTA